MENSLKGLILAAGTVITCVVITLAFYISREAKQTAMSGVKEINQLNVDLAESDKMVYDNAIVTGSEVINVVKKMSGETIGFYVQTKRNTTYYGYCFDLSSGLLGKKAEASISTATQAENENYINPYANFKGTVIHDDNNTITGIKFIQT